MDKATVTMILAIWGATLSSIAIGWNIYRDITQRGRLRVSCYIAKLVDEVSGIDPADYLVWNVTNTGKEPVVLTHIGGALKKSHFMIKPRNQLPRTLKPGEYVLEYSHDLSILGNDLKHLWAIDSLNRRVRAPNKQVKRLKKDNLEDLSKDK